MNTHTLKFFRILALEKSRIKHLATKDQLVETQQELEVAKANLAAEKSEVGSVKEQLNKA